MRSGEERMYRQTHFPLSFPWNLPQSQLSGLAGGHNRVLLLPPGTKRLSSLSQRRVSSAIAPAVSARKSHNLFMATLGVVLGVGIGLADTGELRFVSRELLVHEDGIGRCLDGGLAKSPRSRGMVSARFMGSHEIYFIFVLCCGSDICFVGLS